MTTSDLPTGVDPRVRRARPDDVPAIVELVRQLAIYERAEHEALMTAQQLTEALFAADASVYALVASTEPGGEIVGAAIYFLSFSTWRGVRGIHLEDLIVQVDKRGTGLGKSLLHALGVIAVDRGFARVEWSVLDWNTPAIDFYKALGAVSMDGWSTMRLTDSALTSFGVGV